MVNAILVFVWTAVAMIAMSFWESYSEGRRAWGKGKLGWKINLTKSIKLTAYHFYLFFITLPLLFTLPLIIFGWNKELFGILVSAYFFGMILEDFMWYVVNPKVKFTEWFTRFSDYYPWIKVGKKKVIPLGYVVSILIAVLSWYYLWR